MSSDNIPGRSTDLTPEQGQTTTHGSTNQSALRGLRIEGQPQEVDSITCPELGISGVQHQLPMQISLPQEKMRKIQQDSSRLLAQQSVSVRQITQFVGKTTAILRALPTAPLHYRALQFLMNSVAPVNYIQEGTTDKFNTIVQLDPESKADLTWWSSLNRKDLSTPVIPPAPLLTIESDASNKGWGAVLERQTQTGGVWTAEEATHHINYLELLAAFLAIKAFGKDWRDTAVLLRMDNITAVSYVNHKGGTTSLKLCKLAITMWTWCTSRNITLTAEHLPGHLNVTADQELWLVRDRCDWMLSPHVFQKIQQSMGPLEVDLFASRLTRQPPHFYSWREDPEAAATDAFMQDWSHLRGFANPPWCLISRCLSKVKEEGARIVLVTPLWNTQPWFPVVLELLEDYPRRLVNQPDLVVLPVGQEFLMKQGVPQLIAWPISGNLTYHKAFLQRLQTSCLPHGEIKPILTTVPPLLNGLAGASNEVEILFLDL